MGGLLRYFSVKAPFGAHMGPLGPLVFSAHKLYTEFLIVQPKNQKNYKNRSKKIGTLTKNEKQKCDLQFAPTELNEFHIEILGIFMDFLYTAPGPILGALGGPGPPQGPKILIKI